MERESERERQGLRLRGVGKMEGRVGNKTGGNVKDGGKRERAKGLICCE